MRIRGGLQGNFYCTDELALGESRRRGGGVEVRLEMLLGGVLEHTARCVASAAVGLDCCLSGTGIDGESAA